MAHITFPKIETCKQKRKESLIIIKDKEKHKENRGKRKKAPPLQTVIWQETATKPRKHNLLSVD